MSLLGALLCLCLLSLRSRSLLSLRPAAVAVAAFAILDAGRFAWEGPARAGVWPWAGIDVVAFCVMPGVWAVLLDVRRRPALGRRVGAQPLAGPPPCVPEDRRRLADDAGGSDDGPGDEVGGHDAEQAHLWILPFLACLCYALSLLSLRHSPAVSSHWTGLLQAPRVAVFALALWVGMRARGALPPSARIGVALSLGCGVAVSGGLWSWWPGVQAVAGLSWVVAGAIAWRAR